MSLLKIDHCNSHPFPQLLQNCCPKLGMNAASLHKVLKLETVHICPDKLFPCIFNLEVAHPHSLPVANSHQNTIPTIPFVMAKISTELSVWSFEISSNIKQTNPALWWFQYSWNRSIAAFHEIAK